MLIDIFPRAHDRFLKHPPARRSSRRAGPAADRAGATAPADPYSYLQGACARSHAGILRNLRARRTVAGTSPRSGSPTGPESAGLLSALIRSMAGFLADRGIVRGLGPGPSEVPACSNLEFLRQVRGLAGPTFAPSPPYGPSACSSSSGTTTRPEVLKTISSQHIEAFVVLNADTLGRGSL